MRIWRAALYAIVASAACGTDTSDTPLEPVECPTDGRYLPLRTGASWIYEVTTSNGTHTKQQVVGAIEDVGGQKAGILAFRVTTTKPGGNVVSWQQDTGTAIVRHREQDNSGTTHTDEYFTPFRTRLDEAPEHLVPGTTWTESYEEHVTDVVTGEVTTASKSETWTVESTDAQIVVPAGQFCTLQLRRSSSVGGAAGSTKRYWFARGVGKVREQTDAADHEELASYTP